MSQSVTQTVSQWVNEWVIHSFIQSLNQSKHMYMTPCVLSESDVHVIFVMTTLAVLKSDEMFVVDVL